MKCEEKQTKKKERKIERITEEGERKKGNMKRSN